MTPEKFVKRDRVFQIGERFYRYARLSAADYGPALQLVLKALEAGQVPGAILGNMFNASPSPEEYDAIYNKAPGEEGTASRGMMIELLMDQKRQSVRNIMQVFGGLAVESEAVLQWIADHLLFVPNPDKARANNVKVDKANLADADMFPLDEVDTLVLEIKNHPELVSFFERIKNNPEIPRLMSSDPPTPGQSSGAPSA